MRVLIGFQTSFIWQRQVDVCVCLCVFPHMWGWEKNNNTIKNESLVYVYYNNIEFSLLFRFELLFYQQRRNDDINCFVWTEIRPKVNWQSVQMRNNVIIIIPECQILENQLDTRFAIRSSQMITFLNNFTEYRWRMWRELIWICHFQIETHT